MTRELDPNEILHRAVGPPDLRGDAPWSGESTETAFALAAERERIEAQKHSRALKDLSREFLFKFVTGISTFIMLIVLLQGFSFRNFHLETSVINVLLGATTANFIALGIGLVKGLFPD